MPAVYCESASHKLRLWAKLEQLTTQKWAALVARRLALWAAHLARKKMSICSSRRIWLKNWVPPSDEDVKLDAAKPGNGLEMESDLSIYPLVNCHITMENHHFIAG